MDISFSILCFCLSFVHQGISLRRNQQLINIKDTFMLWTRPIPKLFKKHPQYKHHSNKSPIIITKFGNILLLLAPFLSSSSQLDTLHNQQACCCNALLGSLTFLANPIMGLFFFTIVFPPSEQFFLPSHSSSFSILSCHDVDKKDSEKQKDGM